MITCTKSTMYKILQYNVDQACREEKYENTKWNNRYERVVKLILEVDADIVCLQEMRKLDTSKITVQQFLVLFDEQYDYDLRYRNPTRLAFGQVVMWKREKFFPLKKEVRWLSETPEKVSIFNGFTNLEANHGTILHGLQLALVKDGAIVDDKKFLWIFNTHLALNEEIKTKCCNLLPNLIETLSEGQPWLLTGDFNFFPDKDGDKQRKILTDFGFVDQCKGAKTLKGTEIEGTFVGFEQDEFKDDLKNLTSRLDHIFSNTLISGSNPIIYTKTCLEEEPEELTTRDYPSDHLPLVLDFEF